MKVNCYASVYTDFKDLNPGDTFWDDGNLYIKVNGVLVNSIVVCNAVNLSTGFAHVFDDECQILKGTYTGGN